MCKRRVRGFEMFAISKTNGCPRRLRKLFGRILYRRRSGPDILSRGHPFFRTSDAGWLQNKRVQIVSSQFIQALAMAHRFHTNTVLV